MLPSWTFIKFCLVGTLGTLIDLLGFLMGRRLLGLPLWAATTLGFVLAVLNNFYLNKRWTFRAGKTQMRKQLIKFSLVSVGGLFLSIACVYALVHGLDLFEELAKLVTSGIVLSWNFLLNKNWTFRERETTPRITETFDTEYSVIIPTYNEEKRIIPTLETVVAYFDKLGKPYEVTVVDDGSVDDTTNVIENFISNHEQTRRKEQQMGKSVVACHLSLVAHSSNRGKGAVVRDGMLAAKGRYILFTDADNATPIEEFDKFTPLLPAHDVIVGSRYMRGSRIMVKQSLFRIRVSRLSNRLIQLLLLEGLSDTQCGFKAFHHYAAQQIFARAKTHRFGFDMEILAIARMLGYEPLQIPVDWYDSPESRVRPVRDTLHTLYELFYIKLNVLSGRYE